jgi:hypothetical protein
MLVESLVNPPFNVVVPISVRNPIRPLDDFIIAIL